MAFRATKKDPFAELPNEWKDAIAQSSVEEIDKRIAELSKAEEESQNAKKLDPDLAEKREALKYASEGYKDATKGYKLRMKYIMRVLGDMGKA
jgi:DNA-binding transcriptional regulator GbsR (MarR family)